VTRITASPHQGADTQYVKREATMPEATMQRDDRDLLDVLKFELNFLEKGGYGRSVRTPWRPQFIFEDSLSCMNYENKENKAPCSDCVLFQLVPPDGFTEAVPCRHIPLNAEGETLQSLYGHGNQYETEEVFGKWLRETITKLEAARENRKSETKKELPQFQEKARGIALHQHAHPKCANPACPTVFHWLIGGKFFRFSEKQCANCEKKTESEGNVNHQCVKHFWLCERCSSVFTLGHDEKDGVMLKLLRTELPPAEARKMLIGQAEPQRPQAIK
jgi:hypothetical protein